jgi:hypothetical protein
LPTFDDPPSHTFAIENTYQVSHAKDFDMSGIEVAGIVLGAIPLVISGLEHYAEGARTIKSMWDYPREFKQLSSRLRMEDTMFRNTMELLLSDRVGNRRLEDMLTQPGGIAWAETQVEQELHRILQGSYAVFLETVVRMNEVLAAFIARLRLDPDGKVSRVRTCSSSYQYADHSSRARSMTQGRSEKRISASNLH